jgi:hypothetical protein
MPRETKSRGGSNSRGGNNRSNSSRSEAAKKGWETRRRNTKKK